jgi:hypothetical protein
MKYITFSAVEFLDKELRTKVGQAADKKFGAKNSYAKNLWILREYKKQGGKVKNSGKKPSSEKIKKQVNASIIVDASKYAEKNLDLAAFAEDEQAEKLAFLRSIGLTINTTIKLETSASEGEVETENESEEGDDMEEMIKKELDYVHQRIRNLYSYVENLYNNILNQFYQHQQGHLPKMQSAEQLEKALKVLGLDKEYQVEKKTIYASQEDKEGSEIFALLPKKQ